MPNAKIKQIIPLGTILAPKSGKSSRSGQFRHQNQANHPDRVYLVTKAEMSCQNKYYRFKLGKSAIRVVGRRHSQTGIGLGETRCVPQNAVCIIIAMAQRFSNTRAQRPFNAGTQQSPSTEMKLRVRVGSRDIASNSKGRVEDCAANPDHITLTQTAAETYTRVVEAWGLDDSDAEKLLTADHQTWMQTKKGIWGGSLNQEQLDRIRIIIAIHDVLHSCFGEKAANRWATVLNRLPMFRRRKPVDAVIEEDLPMMEKAQRLTYGLLAGA